ncbi:translation initiation factor IF-3 [Candidatus Nasuia deltocephalinicola]|uniref:translation initiation factor IF-3 n=1 Tax=Candidatus Nasuia deltocephalincola TaxID=1160784 RepID=UPI00216B24DA|nr:translation initiation factor IF-3 [Candidatus Nasuia deltocephalinicola]
MKTNYKINNFITNSIIKLIDINSIYLGIFKKRDCILKCKVLNLDLVEIGTKNNLSICKIIKYKKFLYLESKKNNKNKNLNNKNNKIINLKRVKKNKEIKLHLFTSNNDYFNKINCIKKFLNNNLCVKVTLIIKGREILKFKIIKNNIDKIIFNISHFGVLTNSPNMLNKNIFLNFRPKNVKKKK